MVIMVIKIIVSRNTPSFIIKVSERYSYVLLDFAFVRYYVFVFINQEMNLMGVLAF